MSAIEIIIEPSARRDIKHLDKTTQRRVISALEDFSEGNQVDIRKMKGTDSQYRIRVGDYRIVLEVIVIDNVAYVLRVRHRREVYR